MIVHRSHSGLFPDTDPLVGEGDVLVTAGDDGRVRLFNYPCVVEDAPCRSVPAAAAAAFDPFALFLLGLLWFRGVLGLLRHRSIVSLSRIVPTVLIHS